LVREGTTIQHALRGRFFDYALAAIIWHEMAHLDGADEQRAQRQEEDLWQQYVLDGRVDRDRGARYLFLLKQRHSMGAPRMADGHRDSSDLPLTKRSTTWVASRRGAACAEGDLFYGHLRKSPAFQIVPVNEPEQVAVRLTEDSLYRASVVGRSSEGKTASDHDVVLYSR
jgi:hypothetical protein